MLDSIKYIFFYRFLENGL